MGGQYTRGCCKGQDVEFARHGVRVGSRMPLAGGHLSRYTHISGHAHDPSNCKIWLPKPRRWGEVCGGGSQVHARGISHPVSPSPPCGGRPSHMTIAILLGGGMYSLTALYDFPINHKVAVALSFDYGSEHNGREIPMARWHAGHGLVMWVGDPLRAMRHLRRAPRDLFACRSSGSDHVRQHRAPSAETLASRDAWLIDFCKKCGYCYCPRHHIHLFGNTRGT
jgi:hypothetical protein